MNRRKRRGSVLCGLVALALTASITVQAQAEPAGNWHDLAAKAFANAEADYDALTSAGQNVQAFHVAAAAWYAGQEFGWTDPRTRTWLDRVYDRAVPGGYGIGFAHDYFRDGTVNPADTGYSITTAWHVGRVLIDGYQGGGVPAERVTEAARALLDTGETPHHDCPAYSDNRNDAGYPCVWNVGATAAWFLWRTHELGLSPRGRDDEVVAKLRTWRNHVRAGYRQSLGGWTYMEGGSDKLDDPGHLAATVAAMYEADPTIGKPALAAYWTHYLGSVSAVELVRFDCSKADATYQPVAGFLLADQGSAAKNMTRAQYLPLAEKVAKACGG